MWWFRTKDKPPPGALAPILPLDVARIIVSYLMYPLLQVQFSKILALRMLVQNFFDTRGYAVVGMHPLR